MSINLRREPKIIPEFKIGDKVTYHNQFKGTEYGIVKSLSSYKDKVFVVYNYDDNVEDYNYTAELTHCSMLTLGWE
jgi:hypothetical protein